MKIKYYIVRLIEKSKDCYWLFMNRIAAGFWKIRILGRCHFSGKTIFRNYPGGSIEIGSNCTFNSSKYSNQVGVYSPCMISTINSKAKIKIGKNCGFSGTIIASAINIMLGDNVRCGANTLIIDTDFHTDDPRAGQDKAVLIDDNVWLGVGVKVLKGVHIGQNSIIGAGSVVTKDIPANVIAAGNPCKVIRKI